MKNRPQINEQSLMLALRAHYGLEADHLTFIPFGDSAYGYHVRCRDGNCYFLKLYDGGTEKGRGHIASLAFWLQLTSRLYHEGVFTRLTYPIEGRAGALSTCIDRYGW